MLSWSQRVHVVRSVATCDQVMTKAEYEHAKMLTMAIAADAIADDGSAHTVDVMTEVDQQLSGPIEQKRSRHKPADLEGEKSKASQVPRTIRRDSTLTIPSPSARDAEVMASNQALEDELAVDELAPTDSVPFGIMITDSETRKSVVLLEAPILDPPPQRQHDDGETDSQETEEAPIIMPNIMSTMEEAIWSAVLEEVQQDAEAHKAASLVTSEGQSWPEPAIVNSTEARESEGESQVDELAPTDSVPFGIMITDSETRKSVVLLEAPILDPPPQRQHDDGETDSQETEEVPAIMPSIMGTVQEAIWSVVLEEVQQDAEAYKEASLVTSEGQLLPTSNLEVPTRFPSKAPTEVTILPLETAKTMDELIEEINVLQASLTYSDDLPMDPEADADRHDSTHSLTQPFSDLLGSARPAHERATGEADGTPTSLPEASPQEAFEQTLAEELIDSAVIKECMLGDKVKADSSEAIADDLGHSLAKALLDSAVHETDLDGVEARSSSQVYTEEALQVRDNVSDAGTVTLEEAKEQEEERVAQTLVLTSSLSKPLAELLGADAEVTVSEKAAPDDLSHSLAKALLDSAVHETELDAVEARSSSQVYTEEASAQIQLTKEAEDVAVERPSSGQSGRDPSHISVVTAGSAAMTELVHSLIVSAMPSEKRDSMQSATTLHTEGSELFVIPLAQETARPTSAGLASSVSASDGGSYGLQIAQDAVHTACEAIQELRSDAKVMEQEPGTQSSETERALIERTAQELLHSATLEAASSEARAASMLLSEAPSMENVDLPFTLMEEGPSEVQTEHSGESQDPKNMKEFVHRVVDDVLEHPSPEGSLQDDASQDRSDAETDRQSLAIAGPESICSAGSEEAVLIQAAIGADLLSEGMEDLADITAPSGVVSARTAASLEERLVAEVAGDLLPEHNQAALVALIKELQRRPLQNPEVELHLLGAPAPVQSGEQLVPADTVAEDLFEDVESPELDESPGPAPRFTALKAESDHGAQPTSVPGKPAVSLDFMKTAEPEVDPLTIAAEALALDVLSKEIDTEDLIAIASEALALDVMTQEVQASPTSPNTPSLGEGTVSELSLDQSGFGIPEDMTAAAIQEELDYSAIVVAKALAQDEEVDALAVVSEALALDVLSKEVEEEIDPMAIASQALALDVLSKEVEEEIDPMAIASQALALDVLSKEVEVRCTLRLSAVCIAVAVAGKVPEPEEEPDEPEEEEEPEGPAQEQDSQAEDIISPFHPRAPKVVRPPAGSGTAAAVARRLAQHTIEGLMKLHEEENRELEALVKEKFYTPAPGTKLPTVLSLPALPMDPRKASDETKRILRLNYHRVIGQPAMYQQHRPKSAMDMDLGEDSKLHHAPELQEKRFRRQRVTYQAANVSPAKGGISKKSLAPLAVSQSSPQLPPTTGAERRPPKLRFGTVFFLAVECEL
eukprot:symbB.v1.2.035129.t2/scaffold4662.1/size36764/1